MLLDILPKEKKKLLREGFNYKFFHKDIPSPMYCTHSKPK